MVVTLRPCAAAASVRHDSYAPPVDQHRAGAALAVVASFLRAGQAEMLAQHIEQRGAHIEREPMIPAVDVQRGIDGFARISGPGAVAAAAPGGPSRRGIAAVETVAIRNDLRSAPIRGGLGGGIRLPRT